MKRNRSPILSKVQINIPFPMLVEDYLELFLEYKINPEIGITAEALDRFSLVEFEAIGRQLSDAGLAITIHGPFNDLSPGSPDPEIKRITIHRFNQLLSVIPFFKPKTVVCHAGFESRRYGYLKEKWFDTSIQTWRWVGEKLQRMNTRLMLENVYEDTPDQIEPLLKGLSDCNVGFCFDSGHQNAFSQATIKEWINSLKQYLGQFHLHDNLGSNDSHLALGSGKIDFGELFHLIKGSLQPVITLEPHEEKDLWPSLEFLERHWIWA